MRLLCVQPRVSGFGEGGLHHGQPGLGGGRAGRFAATPLPLKLFADDGKRLVSASGLTHYVVTRVSALTEGAQTPGVEMRFDDTVFATGLRADAGQAR